MAPPKAQETVKPLTNSQRRVYKASYRPLTVPAEVQQSAGRVLEKLAFVRGLDIWPNEYAQLEGRVAEAQPVPATGGQGDGNPPRLLEIMKGLSAGLSFATMRRYGPPLARVSPEELIKIGHA